MTIYYNADIFSIKPIKKWKTLTCHTLKIYVTDRVDIWCCDHSFLLKKFFFKSLGQNRNCVTQLQTKHSAMTCTPLRAFLDHRWQIHHYETYIAYDMPDSCNTCAAWDTCVTCDWCVFYDMYLCLFLRTYRAWWITRDFSSRYS